MGELKISDLIKILEDKKEKHGDLDVYIINGLYRDLLSEGQVKIVASSKLIMVLGSRGW